MTIPVTTTAAEDAAILALTGETPDAFVQRHVRHQLNFALSQVREDLKAVYDILPAGERAAVDVILTRNRPAPRARSRP